MDDCATYKNVAPILGTGVPIGGEEYITLKQAIDLGADPEPLAKYKSDNELVLLKDIVKRSGGILRTVGRVGVSFMNGFDLDIVSGSINMTLYVLDKDLNLVDNIYISGDLIRDNNIFNGEEIYAVSRKELPENMLLKLVNVTFIGNHSNGTQIIYDIFMNNVVIGHVQSNGSAAMLDSVNYNNYSSNLFDTPIEYGARFEQLQNFIYSIRVSDYTSPY